MLGAIPTTLAVTVSTACFTVPISALAATLIPSAGIELIALNPMIASSAVKSRA